MRFIISFPPSSTCLRCVLPEGLAQRSGTGTTNFKGQCQQEHVQLLVPDTYTLNAEHATKIRTMNNLFGRCLTSFFLGLCKVLQKEALKEAAFDVIDLIDSEDETCQKEPASELPSQSMSRAASSLAPPRIAGAAPSWDPIRTATAQMGQTLAAGYHGAGGGLEDPASLPSVSANCPNQNLADTRDAPTIEGASSMDAHLRTANGNASTLARAQPGGSGVPRTTSMALSNTSGNPNARAGQWASSQRSARGLQDGESEAAEAGDDSCLTSTWRLPGLGGDWGVEDVNIRIPPLPPGRLFEEEYEVRFLSIVLYAPFWRTTPKA